jgi:hypothetical protein
MTIPSGAVNNGLPADDWARLDSVPFPVMQHLLVGLRAAAIPAFAVADVDESPLRALNRRSPLNQRIYVDRARLAQAREVLSSEVASYEQALLTGAVDSDFAHLASQLDSNSPSVEWIDLEYREREEHFEPPMPELVISSDPITRAAWAGVIGGPALLLLSLFGVISLGGFAPAIAVVAFVAGFLALVVRMPDRLSIDEGPDDGAVV